MMIFNDLLLVACVREIYRGRGNRVVAAGLGLIFLVGILMANGVTTAGAFFAASQFVSVLAVGVMLIKRAWDSWNENNRIRGEVAAAREVQQVLVPEVPENPGFVFESVYKPAGEVGGDFFQVIPAGDGSTLVVIGDVSGKGMPAAMTVSLLVGTVRGLAHYTQSPREILAALNLRMLARSRGGFTTCLVVHVSPDGSLTACECRPSCSLLERQRAGN